MLDTPDSMWSEYEPKLQIAWDATSMNALQTCPRKYQYQIIESWSSRKFAAPLTFGILLHQAVEKYHRLCSEMTHDQACSEIAKFCMREGRKLSESQDDTRNRFTLTRAALWYLDKYSDDSAKTVILSDGKPAVELSFRVELPPVGDERARFLWCGHIDRLCTISDIVHVSDVKTTKYSVNQAYFAKFTPNNQVSGYIYATHVLYKQQPASVAIIDAIELKVTFNRFFRGLAVRTSGQIREWIDNTLEWIALAERMAEDEFWPMNLESCDKYGGCPFREVCSKDPSTRSQWIKADFEQKPWNPLQNREG